MTSRTIKTGDDWTSFAAFIGDMPFPYRVTVSNKPKRTVEQNALVHVWFGQIASHLGDTPADEVKANCNLTIGRRILVRDDPAWAEMWGKCFEPLNREAKLKAIQVLDVPFTRGMSVPQLCEYMTDMQRHAATRGILLEDKEGLSK